MTPAERLVTAALATFHASAFMLAFVLAEYLSGNLANVLGSLNTLLGFAIFLWLWLATAYTTGRALAGSGWPTRGDVDTGFVARGLRWGALNGAVFLVALVIAGVLGTAVVTGNISVLLGLGVLALATPFALVIGAVLGVFFATVDTALLVAARAVGDGCVERD